MNGSSASFHRAFEALLFLLFFASFCSAAIFSSPNTLPDQKEKQTEGGEVLPTKPVTETNFCFDGAGNKRKNGEEWIAGEYFVMLCHMAMSSNQSSGWPIMRVEVVACLREDHKTRISVGAEAEESPGKFIVCKKENPADPIGIVRREWRYAPVEDEKTCLDNEGKKRKNGEEWIAGEFFVMLCHELSGNQSYGPFMQVEVVACLREDRKTKIRVGSEVEETPGRFIVCRKADTEDPSSVVWREWQVAPSPVESAETCLDNDGKRHQNGEEWIAGDYFVLNCHKASSTNQSVLPAMRIDIIACLREDRKTRIAVGSEVEESPGRFLICRKDPADPNGMVWREWRMAPQPVQPIQPVSPTKNCVDTEGRKTRQNGEEWIVGDYFVFTCHEVPPFNTPAAIMRSEVIACLREDKKTRIPVGSEVEESPGMVLTCRRANPADPFGAVLREWHVAAGRASTNSSSAKSGPKKTNGCFGEQIGAHLKRNNFVFECPSSFALPKLVACLPPQLKGARILPGEYVKIGRVGVSCEQRKDGTMLFQYSL